jgi:hypothetical protein
LTKSEARPFFPPRPADAPSEPDYSAPGVLEEIGATAGLTPEQAFDAIWAFEFPDNESMTPARSQPPPDSPCSSDWSTSQSSSRR